MLLGTALLFLFGASRPVQASDAPAPDPRQVLWQRSLADALALAGAERRPIFLAVNMDGESASDRIVDENYRDPAFVAASRACVCVVASVFRHSARDHDDEGRRIPCPRLGEVTCGEHIALEPLLHERFLADGERVAPRHALILPDGTKAWDLSLCFDLGEIDRALVGSLSTLPPPADAQAPADAGWTELTTARDARGRARLEAALAQTTDEGALSGALAALAADGDAGSLDALLLLGARVPRLPEAVVHRLVDSARALGLARPLALALRARLVAPGSPALEPGPGERAALLPVLAELDGAMPDTRTLLLACSALADYGAPATAALRIAFGNDGAATLALCARARGGPLSLRAFLEQAEAGPRAARDSAPPRQGPVTEAMPETEALESELETLDAELAQRGDDPGLRARFAKALLDLARRRLETGASGAETLLEDAETSFALALAADPDRVEWWIERARAAYFRQRFAEELEYGRRALTLTGTSGEDALAVESLRWVGEADARLLGQRAGGPPALELGGILEGLRALAAVAASPYANGTDWTSCASFLGALGLQREAIAVALRGARRLPAAGELRQALNGALWSAGRIDLAPALAEEIAARDPGSAEALGHAGYAWILAAEDLRRHGACEPALAAYETARQRYAAAAARKPDWGAECAFYIAIAWLGSGLAEARLERRARAADALVAAAASGVALAGARDGLGYDVFDLVDRVLEWRASGPSPVEPLALLDRLEAVAPGTAFWAAAISDCELREALRADGRNPERAERDGVDAVGNPIRQVTGLPWAEGDLYLERAIEAGRRALALATDDVDRKPLAQACTILAERRLELGRLDDVAPALAEAAAVQGLDPPTPGADEAALRELARRLRAALGEARPRLRPGR